MLYGASGIVGLCPMPVAVCLYLRLHEFRGEWGSPPLERLLVVSMTLWTVAWKQSWDPAIMIHPRVFFIYNHRACSSCNILATFCGWIFHLPTRLWIWAVDRRCSFDNLNTMRLFVPSVCWWFGLMPWVVGIFLRALVWSVGFFLPILHLIFPERYRGVLAR